MKRYTNDLNFSYTRIGKIIEVYTDTATVDVIEETHEMWRGGTSPVPIIYPYLGDGAGIYFMPQVGDRGLMIYYGEGRPFCVGFIPFNFNAQTLGLTLGTMAAPYKRLRSLVKGEICLKTASGGELFIDQYDDIKSNPEK